jgi:hypothetical protein
MQLYRLPKFLLNEIMGIIIDPQNLRKVWEAWKARERRGLRRRRLLVRRKGLDVRAFLHMMLRKIKYYHMVMAASVAAGILLIHIAARGRDGAVEEDEDPRLLRLEVWRNLRVMAFRLATSSPRALPRWPPVYSEGTPHRRPRPYMPTTSSTRTPRRPRRRQRAVPFQVIATPSLYLLNLPLSTGSIAPLISCTIARFVTDFCVVFTDLLMILLAYAV